MDNISNYVELGLAMLGVASIIAKLTPTEVDNKVVGILIKIVHVLGLTKK